MAEVKVLIEGFTNADRKQHDGVEETRSTISLVRDRNIVMVVDPGVLSNQQLLVDALQKEGLRVNDVNIVCLTHSHIDHYRNVGMFPKAKVLEYFGLWDGGKVEDWQQDFSTDIQILKTPGHDYSCITLFVKTDDGVVAICGDVFWKENGPNVDPYASDTKALKKSRELVLKMSNWIVPGHAAIYKTSSARKLMPKENGKIVVPVLLGRCKDCRKPFKRLKDKCPCQEWLCYHCCECEADCGVCHCKHKI